MLRLRLGNSFRNLLDIALAIWLLRGVGQAAHQIQTYQTAQEEELAVFFFPPVLCPLERHTRLP
jgi:hypothetical protein